MSPAAAWRLDRLSDDTRILAESASAQAGQPLSAWLAQLIGEACTAEGIMASSQAIDAAGIAPAARERGEPAAPRSAAAVAMLPVAAMVAAGLGTRRRDEVPEGLLADIAERGVRQPLLLRRAAASEERYEIISGHRRWRAAKRAGLGHVPASLCAHDDGQALLASLAANLPLGDLSLIEEAEAYLRLLAHFGLTLAAVAAATGRDRKHITRAMRLLGLSQRVRDAIANGSLSAEHAYLLLDAPDPEELAAAILADHLSTEAILVRIANAPHSRNNA